MDNHRRPGRVVETRPAPGQNLLDAYHAALAMYAHEPPTAATRRLNAVTNEATQWENPKRPRKRKK